MHGNRAAFVRVAGIMAFCQSYSSEFLRSINTTKLLLDNIACDTTQDDVVTVASMR